MFVIKNKLSLLYRRVKLMHYPESPKVNAYTYVCMVVTIKNALKNQNYYPSSGPYKKQFRRQGDKKIKNILFSSCVRETYVRLTYKYEQKQSFLAFIVTRGLCAKLIEFTQNLSGATTSWVSTSVWESLQNAKKLHFCSYLCHG